MTFRTPADLVADAKARITEISAADLRAMREGGAAPVVVDVREPNEWNLGHVPGAVHIPRGWLEFKIEGAAGPDDKVVVYCAGGDRSALAADTLRAMGYRDVASLAGGFRAWYEAGGDVED